jgi:hypothetical protein
MVQHVTHAALPTLALVCCLQDYVALQCTHLNSVKNCTSALHRSVRLVYISKSQLPLPDLAGCKPGHGGAECQQCSSNTWSAGWAANNRTGHCKACAEGTEAPAGSTSKAACVAGVVRAASKACVPGREFANNWVLSVHVKMCYCVWHLLKIRRSSHRGPLWLLSSC